jgi:hypothetical protein
MRVILIGTLMISVTLAIHAIGSAHWLGVAGKWMKLAVSNSRPLSWIRRLPTVSRAQTAL